MTGIRLSRIVLGVSFSQSPSFPAAPPIGGRSISRPIQPPAQSADEMGRFGSQAPTGGSQGGVDQQATGAGEETGDPAFQPHPAR